MWNGKRPDLIVCDDMEDDEQVENKDRRSKFRRWFFRAAKQALSKAGRIRVHGTILHDDSLLARLIKNKAWTFLFFKAHRSYDDFSDLIWPEQWNAEELRKIQIEFEEDGDSGGYSQEYLNTPLDNADAFLKKDWFLPMREEDYNSQKKMYAGADFAVSKADLSNRTSFTAGGKDVLNQISIVGQVKGRWDTAEWIDELFDFNERWQPELFFVEGGVIWLSVYPMIVKEMQERDIYINFEVRQPIKDKATRGRQLQKRMKVGNVRFDKQAEWYPDFEQELLKFTGGSQALLDDQFDSAAILLAGMESVPNLEEEDFEEEDEIEVNYFNRHMNRGSERRTSTSY
jgi:predicted phage terminase large subunit-like protein